MVSISDGNLLPNDCNIFPNYPNPFNPSTQISFNLKENDKVLLEMYNMNGRKLETLIDSKLESGIHNLRLDGSLYATGIYFIKLRTSNSEKNQKIMLLK